MFQEGINEKSVRYDSAADINTLVRLREFLEGRADQRTEINHVFSLASVQQAHEQWRERVIDVTPSIDGTEEEDPELAAGGQVLDATFEPQNLLESGKSDSSEDSEDPESDT